MAEGLAERERIREAFGTYVDPDVAERVLAEGTNLAGEEVEVTAMFIDIRNFTGFAERTPAREVVATINRLFERIVPIIHADGGVEAATRQTGDAILLTEETTRLLRDRDEVELVERPGIELKGKSEPLRLYAVAT